MDSGFWGAILLALGTVISSVAAAWLTAKGARSTAQVTTKPVLEGSTNDRIEMLFQEYKEGRAEDALEIKELKATVKQQGKEIDELKARLPRYRAYIRKLRHIIESLGGDPGPWPADLE